MKDRDLSSSILKVLIEDAEHNYNYKQIASVLGVKDPFMRKRIVSLLSQLHKDGQIDLVSRGNYQIKDASRELEGTLQFIAKGGAYFIHPEITKDILEGLNEIHSKGFIHTDIKLENILLTKRLKKIKYNNDIKIKISDFGTAHHIKNKCEFGVGTLEYQAPEALLGLPYGKVLDVWSVGCIMFELLTGYCLFDYTRYWIEGDDYSSASSYSSSEYDEEEDDEKYPVELTLLAMMRRVLGGFDSKLFKKGMYF